MRDRPIYARQPPTNGRISGILSGNQWVLTLSPLSNWKHAAGLAGAGGDWGWLGRTVGLHKYHYAEARHHYLRRVGVQISIRSRKKYRLSFLFVGFPPFFFHSLRFAVRGSIFFFFIFLCMHIVRRRMIDASYLQCVVCVSVVFFANCRWVWRVFFDFPPCFRVCMFA